MTSAIPSSTVPDWSREAVRRFYDPPRKVLRSIRDYQRWRNLPIPFRWLSKMAVIRHRFWSVVAGCDIPINTIFDGGLILLHPVGVVLHCDVTIGPNCLIAQGVTLGTGGRLPGVPKLLGHVDVGAGACVLGGVTLGEHSVVGANAVVLDDVPPWHTAVGVPARVFRRRDAPDL